MNMIALSQAVIIRISISMPSATTSDKHQHQYSSCCITIAPQRAISSTSEGGGLY
jgi:hypothetical protein